MDKRTEKVFKDYNDYEDRPFGLKWGTAFALDELTKVITHNKQKAIKDIKELQLMTRREIDKVLQEAFLKTKKVSIQLNSRDEYDQLKESIVGQFEGFSDEGYLYMGKVAICWESIRNVQIIKS